MLKICNEYSQEFKTIIHKVLNIVLGAFIEIGSNLDYDELYAIVFPLHLQGDEIFIRDFLKIININVIDSFNHEVKPLDEYVLYHIFLFLYEGSDDGFILTDTIEEYLTEQTIKKLDDHEIIELKNIETPYDLISICFEDVDFLDVGEFFEWYKINPLILSDFFHVDLDYYIDLMPEDILLEYNKMKQSLSQNKKQMNISNKKHFYQIIIDLVNIFNHYVVHKKLHSVINGTLGELGEKEVQAIFRMFADEYLRKYNIIVSPEEDTGRGAVDFHLSYGFEYQALLEFKLGSSKRVDDGINYQLPIYLIADDIDFGIFVLICYSDEVYEESKYLYDEAEKVSKKYNKNIKFTRINATGNYKTGSNIKKYKEMELEDWRNFN